MFYTVMISSICPEGKLTKSLSNKKNALAASLANLVPLSYSLDL